MFTEASPDSAELELFGKFPEGKTNEILYVFVGTDELGTGGIVIFCCL